MNCPKCGVEVHENDAYCPRCGEVLKKENNEVIKLCPNCNSNVEKGASFCPFCNYSFIAQKEEPKKEEDIYLKKFLGKKYNDFMDDSISFMSLCFSFCYWAYRGFTEKAYKMVIAIILAFLFFVSPYILSLIKLPAVILVPYAKITIILAKYIFPICLFIYIVASAMSFKSDYLEYANEEIEKIKNKNISEEEKMKEIEKAGKPNIVGAIIISIVAFISIFGIYLLYDFFKVMELLFKVSSI